MEIFLQGNVHYFLVFKKSTKFYLYINYSIIASILQVSTCTALFSLPLCVSLRSQTTNLETLQTYEPSYDILLSDVSTTDIVVHYKAIISQESCLINCGDYIELCSNYQQVR